jgi:hypothetical protein
LRAAPQIYGRLTKVNIFHSNIVLDKVLVFHFGSLLHDKEPWKYQYAYFSFSAIVIDRELGRVQMLSIARCKDYGQHTGDQKLI